MFEHASGAGAEVTARVLFLRKFPLLRGLSAAAVASIARQLRARRFAAGAVISDEAERSTGVYALMSGKARMERRGHVFAVLDAPETFGFLPFIARIDDGFSVIAETDVEVLEVSGDLVLEVLDDDFDLLLATFRGASRAMLHELVLGLLPPSPLLLGLPLDHGPATLVDRMFFLKSTPMFRRANLDAIADLAAALEEVRIAPGTVIWSRGEAAESALVILSGALRARTEHGVQTFGPGTFPGSIELAAEEPRWFDAVAEGPVIALRGSGQLLLDAFEDNPDMVAELLSMVARSLLEAWDAKAAAGVPKEGLAQNLSALLVPDR